MNNLLLICKNNIFFMFIQIIMQIFQKRRLLFILFFNMPFWQEIIFNNKFTVACLAQQIQRSEILSIFRINDLIKHTQLFSFKQNHSCKVFIPKLCSYVQQCISSRIFMREQIFPDFISILIIIIIPIIQIRKVSPYNMTILNK